MPLCKARPESTFHRSACCPPIIAPNPLPPRAARPALPDALAGSFDDNEVQVLVEAFDKAWKRVQEEGGSLVGDGHAEATRELLALRIIEIAQLGERDRAAYETTRWPFLARTNPMSTGL